MKLSRLKRNKGFTLVEVVTVVGIVMCLAALSIHGLLRVRVNANDGAASGSIKSIAAAMESYRAVNNSYPSDLDTLINANPPYLSNAYADGNNQGFDFYIPFADNNGYAIWAQPEHFGVTGSKFLVYSQGGQEQFEGYESAAAYVNEVANMQLASADGVPGLPTGYTDGGGDGDTGVEQNGPDDPVDPNDAGGDTGGDTGDDTGIDTSSLTSDSSSNTSTGGGDTDTVGIFTGEIPIDFIRITADTFSDNSGIITGGTGTGGGFVADIIYSEDDGLIVRLPKVPIGILEPLDPRDGDDADTGTDQSAEPDDPEEDTEAASVIGFN